MGEPVTSFPFDVKSRTPPSALPTRMIGELLYLMSGRSLMSTTLT